jgi:hypothetical protein
VRYTLVEAANGYVLERVDPSEHPPWGSRADWLAVADAIEQGPPEGVVRNHLRLMWFGTCYVLLDPHGPQRLEDAYPVPPLDLYPLAAHIREVVA